MTVAVDLGCADHGIWPSMETMVELFDPTHLYGFDPSATLDTDRHDVNGTPCTLERKAAWIGAGWMPYHEGSVIEGGEHRVGPLVTESDTLVEAFDFSAWLADHGPAAVKMDIEGAEYGVVNKLIEDGTHRLLTFLFVEWHGMVPEVLVDQLECPVVRWWM